jgi:predicted TPR repeat methyltransferase
MDGLKNIEKQDQQLFNRIAKKYASKDQYIVSAKAREFQLMSLFKLIEKKLNKNHFSEILELGCGAGVNSRYLINYFDNYTGIDYSDEFIALANEFYSNSNVKFLFGNLKDFTFDKPTYELIIGIGILHHLPDIGIVLRNLKKQMDQETLYGFIEVQSGNPVIQLMRRIRKRIDSDYSKEQNAFSKKFILKTFQQEDFDIIDFLYQGYFTPPFAQVKLKPKWIMLPLVKLAIILDQLIQTSFPNALSWNIVWIARLKKHA